MKRVIATAALTGALVFSVQTFADDSMSQSTQTTHQMMKSCMAKQKANNASMSYASRKKACKDQMRGDSSMQMPKDSLSNDHMNPDHSSMSPQPR